MTAITDWDRFEAHWQDLKEMVDKTADVELLDTIEADLSRLANHARERSVVLETDMTTPESAKQ